MKRFLVALVLGVFVGSVQAARVEYDFLGLITNVGGALSDAAEYPNQTLLSGSFVYDTDWPTTLNQSHFGPDNGNYGILVDYSGHIFDSATANTQSSHILNVSDNTQADGFSYNSTNLFADSFALYFETTTNLGFTTNGEIPSEFVLSDFDLSLEGNVIRRQDGNAGNITGRLDFDIIQLTAVAPVPIPAAFWLFGSGLGLLAFMRKMLS